MSPAKIESTAVELAINAARDALANSAFAWIRKSSLVERAYLLGLYNGLDAIVEEGTLGNKLARMMVETMWSRSADDSFDSTRIGRDFAALEKGARTGNGIDQQAIETVNRDIDLLNQEWRSCVDSARAILSEFKSASAKCRSSTDDDVAQQEKEREYEYLVSALRDSVRYMALLETHHEISARFDLA